MRKRYRVLLIAAFAAALVVPVGYALSLEPQQPSARITRSPLRTPAAAAVVASPVVVHVTATAVGHDESPASPLASMPDAGKLLLVGTMLFGLSALVRKAI
jgi:hypothetical protein